MSSKLNYILLLVFSLSNSLLAQKQASNWINDYIIAFKNSGISVDPINNPYFVTAPHSKISNSMSNENGNLLFYFYFNKVYNRKDQIMLNGDNMIYFDSTFPKSSPKYEIIPVGYNTIVIPSSKNKNIYYLFFNIFNEPSQNAGKFCYAMVDMEGDNGLGEVIEKNQWISKFATIGMTATFHQNNEYVWLAVNGNYDTIYAYLINDNGIQKPIKSTTGFQSVKQIFNYSEYSVKMRFSPDGTKLYYIYDWYSKDNSIMDSFAFVIYDFDKETGEFSNPIYIHSKHKDNTMNTCVWDAEFTSDSRYLYVAYVDYRANSAATYLNRYDISFNNASSITNSVIDTPNTFSSIFHLGIDGNIYGNEKVIYNSTDKYRFCIAKSSVSYQSNTNFISNYFERHSTNDDIQLFSTCKNKPVVAYSKLYSSPDSFYWVGNDTNGNPIISYDNPFSYIYQKKGKYKLTLNRYYDTTNCPISKEVAVFAGSFHEIDTTVCSNYPIITQDGRKLNQNGKYFDTLTNIFGCDSILKINLVSNPSPELDLGHDTTLCLAEISIALDAGMHQEVLWLPTYETTSIINVTNGGQYKAIVTNQFGCTNLDSVIITDKCEGQIYLPNAFTPNGDNLNETFRVVSNMDFTDFLFIIYNRWGQEVFRTTDQTKGWDGTYKNQKCPEGVYLYVINYKTKEDNFKSKTGNITLLR